MKLSRIKVFSGLERLGLCRLQNLYLLFLRRKITEENFIDAFNLNLGEGQAKYVSHPIRSLAQAYVYREQCQPFGIYDEDEMVGYVMVIYVLGNVKQSINNNIRYIHSRYMKPAGASQWVLRIFARFFANYYVIPLHRNIVGSGERRFLKCETPDQPNQLTTPSKAGPVFLGYCVSPSQRLPLPA